MWVCIHNGPDSWSTFRPKYAHILGGRHLHQIFCGQSNSALDFDRCFHRRLRGKIHHLRPGVNAYAIKNPPTKSLSIWCHCQISNKICICPSSQHICQHKKIKCQWFIQPKFQIMMKHRCPSTLSEWERAVSLSFCDNNHPKLLSSFMSFDLNTTATHGPSDLREHNP